jgi:cysteinyl-tRNA synthetase
MAAACLAIWKDFDRVLGFLAPVEELIPAAVMALVEQRTQARTAKNWAESDRVRGEIEAAGYTVKDTPQGPKVRRKS